MLSSQLYRSSQVAGIKNPTFLKMATQPNRIDRIEFNLSTGNYRDLIQQIRSIVQQPGRYSHNRPVLPVRLNVEPQDWLDVVLSTDNHNITLRIRQDNLYLDGYQMESSQTQCGQWLEFNKDDGTTTHLIPGSTFLGFTGGYPALANAGQRSIEGTQVSRAKVVNAVDQLAQTTDLKSRARYLALLIMVICEATRFEEMSRRFANVMQFGSSSTEEIEDWMLRLFRAWGDLSGRLIRADADGDQYFRLPSDSPLRQRIQNALDAASYVGLLLGTLSRRPQSRLGAPAKSNAGDVNVPRGQPMMEVLSIQIIDYSGDLSGTIMVTDGLGPQTLFNGRQKVQSGDTLTLALLNRAITAWESVVFDFNLTVESGTASWDIFQTKDTYADDNNRIQSIHLAKYGTRPSKSGDDTNVKFLVYYGLFREAWQIIWEVKIVNGDGYNPMNVYGSVNVSYSDGGNNYNVKLFSRKSDDNVIVYVGGCVNPLLRKAMAVPLDVDVNVDLDLWDYIHVFPDQCIVQGRARFRFGSNDAAKAKNVGSYILKLAGNENSCVHVTAFCSRVSDD